MKSTETENIQFDVLLETFSNFLTGYTDDIIEMLGEFTSYTIIENKYDEILIIRFNKKKLILKCTFGPKWRGACNYVYIYPDESQFTKDFINYIIANYEYKYDKETNIYELDICLVTLKSDNEIDYIIISD